MKLELQKSSLSRDYFVFALIISASIFLLILVFSSLVYNSQEKNRIHRLRVDALRIDRSIQETFDYTNHLANALGRQIAETDDRNLEYIANLFRTTSAVTPESVELFSWSLFDWVTPDKKIVVSSKHGIMKNPLDISIRSYADKASTDPWKLHVSAPSIGIPSGQWVIPAGVGVTDRQGDYIGAIGAGFNINRFIQKIERAIGSSVSFVVIGEDWGKDYQVVMNSTDNWSVPVLSDFTPAIMQADKKNLTEMVLDKAIEHNNVKYIFYQKMDQYPYHIFVGYHKNMQRQEFLEVLFPRILEFVAMNIFCLILLFFLRRRIINPIVKLSNAVDRISHGEEKVQVPIKGPYEIENLAMQVQQVSNYVDELKRVREELLRKSQMAESANKAKSEFLACMSHELRTPLNAVIAFSEILKEQMFGSLGNEKYTEYANDIYSSGMHLLNIINDILDLSKAEAGMITLKKDEVNIEHAIRDCLSIVSERALQGNIQLKMHIQKNIPPLYSDELRLKQIIINLLSNAIKFTPEGGEVNVMAKAEFEGDTVTDYYIIIRDTGIGMAQGDIPKAVEKFGQLDTGLNRKFEGTGLGLPLTKKLIEIHQGNLSIESAVGQGTTVIIHFPQGYQGPKEENVGSYSL